MVNGQQQRISTKSTRAPRVPSFNSTRSKFDQTRLHFSTAVVKDLRQTNLLNEFFPFDEEKVRVQETVEILPQPVSCERIFYSYIDDHTLTRSRTDIQLDQEVLHPTEEDPTAIYANAQMMKLLANLSVDHRYRFDFYSSTLYIFPKQRKEKFISEIRYCPEHVTIKYKTSLEVLGRTVTPTIEHFYENLPDLFSRSADIFYRI